MELRRFLRDSVTTAHLEDELEAHRLLGLVYRESNRPSQAIAHFILAGDASEAATVADQLDEYVDCLADAQSPQYQCRTAAFAAAAAQADLIPDSLVLQWATIGVAAAQSREGSAAGQKIWINAYKLLAGLSRRIPEEVVDGLLADIGTLLDREHDTGTHVDRQLAKILIALSEGCTDHQGIVAEHVATAYERAGDVADRLVIAVDALTPILRLVEQRLRDLVTSRRDRRATLTLVELGDRSEAVVNVADEYVSEELERTPAYSENSSSILGSVHEPAIMAACLPTERRIQLARHFVERVLDVEDAEDNRDSFAAACEIMAEQIPDDVRGELFQRLLPLTEDQSASQNIFDVIAQRYQDPLGFMRIRQQTGQLRRRVVATLASLAVDEAQKEMVWGASQRLFKSGAADDSLMAARTGYNLAKTGYPIDIPWNALAHSAEPGMRQLAVALLPYQPQFQPAIVEELAHDKETAVRHELALSLRKIPTNSDPAVADLVNLMRNDPSHRVRYELSTE
jgi:hypothetical protein